VKSAGGRQDSGKILSTSQRRCRVRVEEVDAGPIGYRRGVERGAGAVAGSSVHVTRAVVLGDCRVRIHRRRARHVAGTIGASGHHRVGRRTDPIETTSVAVRQALVSVAPAAHWIVAGSKWHSRGSVPHRAAADRRIAVAEPERAALLQARPGTRRLSADAQCPGRALFGRGRPTAQAGLISTTHDDSEKHHEVRLRIASEATLIKMKE